ncbi:MAG: hypothetical protein V3R20_01805 [Sphingomonadales bacterium]
MKKLFYPLLLLVWIFVPHLNVQAQQADTNEELRRCALIDEEIARYRCYDRVLRPGESNAPATSAPTTPAPAATPAPVIAPAETERDRFGVKERRPSEPGFIDVVIVKLGESLLGRMLYYTEDGQVWQQTDNKKTPIYRKTPFAARIKRGTMDSFFVKPDYGGFSVRVHRKK